MFPIVKRERLADRVDAFIEQSAFSADEIIPYYKAAKEMVSCDIAKELIADPLDVDINNLGTNINGKFSENGSFIEGSALYFTGTQSQLGNKVKVKGGIKGKYDSIALNRIYKSERLDEEWQKKVVGLLSGDSHNIPL